MLSSNSILRPRAHSEIDDYCQTGYKWHRGEDYERKSPPIRSHQSATRVSRIGLIMFLYSLAHRRSTAPLLPFPPELLSDYRGTHGVHTACPSRQRSCRQECEESLAMAMTSSLGTLLGWMRREEVFGSSVWPDAVGHLEDSRVC